MYRVRLCRVLLDPTLRVINVKHLSLNSSKPIQSARFFSTTKLVRSVDPDSLQFESASTIVSNGAEPTLFSQGLGLANHYPSGYMQVINSQSCIKYLSILHFRTTEKFQILFVVLIFCKIAPMLLK